MNRFARLEKVADAVLYEGYLLYPYCRDALKNRRRWTFGCLVPAAWAAAMGEPSWAQAEVLAQGDAASRLSVRCRFLRLSEGDAVEARIDAEGALAGLDERRLFSAGMAEAALSASAVAVGGGAYRVRVRLDNASLPEGACPPARDEALARGLLSCHVLLGIEGGTFLSSIDPPAERREAAAGCRNAGLWPVLAGDPAAPALMLAAPIILYDHPRLAPQSPAETFDGTEMDEMLRLHLLALTDDERREVASDARAARLAEGLGGTDALRMRGAWRAGPRPGDRVRLRPAGRADLLDLALAGKEATVVAVDEDLEGRRHVSVVIDDDPGRDLGLAGWPGHRFFFSVEETEAMP